MRIQLKPYRIWACFFCTILLTACQIENYSRPATELPVKDKPNSLAIDRQWWLAFGDDTLNQLIQEALIHNYDLKAAAARVDEAAAIARITNAERFPSLGLSAGVTDRKNRSAVSSEYVNADWEVDLWGRIRELNTASGARLAASIDAQHAAALSISALTANTYFQLRSLDEQYDIAVKAIDSLRVGADLEYKRWKAKLGTELLYRQSLADLANLEVVLPKIEREIVQTNLALDILTGRTPRAFAKTVTVATNINPPTVPLEIDSTLLLRRPDVLSAERLLAASHADVNAARTDFFPRVMLSAAMGNIGLASQSPANWPAFWDTALDMTMPLWNAGATQAGVDVAVARNNQALANYQSVVNNAFRDGYESLATIPLADRTTVAAQTAATSSARAYELNKKRYEVGYASKFEILSTENDMYEAQFALADAKFKQLAARTNFYKAFGGGY